MKEMADCLAAKVGMAFCSNVIWGPRDASGVSHPASTGGHCEAVCGVYLDEHGDLGFVRQQSWGDQPSGPSVLKYAGGTIQLRQGSYGAKAVDLASALSGGGEVWGYRAGFAYPAEVGEMT